MRATCLINNYNYARFVTEAVEGALRQTSPFDEIIVVDDGSTDGSLEKLNANFARCPTVQIVGKPNAGQLSCFNEGLARAKGDVVFFLDADDLYEPDYVSKALEVYRRRPDCDFLVTGRRLFGHKEGVRLDPRGDRDLGYSVIRTLLAHAWVGGATSCLSMRRRVLEKFLPLPFEEDWRVRADDCLVFGSSLAGARKRSLARPLVRYRVHNNNHFFGQESEDCSDTYRRRLAVSRLLEHLQRELCLNADRLADFPHREFQTIERPTLAELKAYARVGMGGGGSMVRRVSRIVEMTRHYLREASRRAPVCMAEDVTEIGPHDSAPDARGASSRQPRAA